MIKVIVGENATPVAKKTLKNPGKTGDFRLVGGRIPELHQQIDKMDDSRLRKRRSAAHCILRACPVAAFGINYCVADGYDRAVRCLRSRREPSGTVVSLKLKSCRELATVNGRPKGNAAFSRPRLGACSSPRVAATGLKNADIANTQHVNRKCCKSKLRGRSRCGVFAEDLFISCL
jgi:hypothetical protein